MATAKGDRPRDDLQANRHDRCSGGQFTPLARAVLEDMSGGQDQERSPSLHPDTASTAGTKVADSWVREKEARESPVVSCSCELASSAGVVGPILAEFGSFLSSACRSNTFLLVDKLNSSANSIVRITFHSSPFWFKTTNNHS